MACSNRSSFITAEQNSIHHSRKTVERNPNVSETRHEHQNMLDQSSSTVYTLSDGVNTVISESSNIGDDLEKKNESLTEKGPSTPVFKTPPIAWLVLFFIVCLRAAVSLFGNTFTPIPKVTADFMGVSLSSINWLYTIMSICYIIASFFTSYIYCKIGVKWALFLSGVLLSFGCWIRWVAVKIQPPSFPVLMFGQSLASLSSPIILNITTLFSALWFTEDKRATAGMFIVSSYGTIIARFLMPSIATGKDKIELTVIIVACIASVATVPFLFLPKQPRTPVSIMATNMPEKPQLTLRQGTILLLKNPHFLILCVIHGLNIGLSIAWSGLMNQAVSPYGYTDSDVGNIGAIGVIGGTLGCLISGPVIDKTKQHKILLKIMAPLMLSTYVAFIFVIKPDSFAAILYTNMLNQFFLSFMVPVCLELGVEISYPVNESLSTSILWQIGQLVGVILVPTMDFFRDNDGVPKRNMFKALIFQAAFAGITFIFAIIFNGPLARTEALKIQQKFFSV